MINLKRSKSEKKNLYGVKSVASDENYDDYPYWTRMDLDSATIKKLDMEDVKAGDMVEIHSIAKVVSIRTEATGKTDKTETMEIQMQKIEIVSADKGEKAERKKIGKDVFKD